MPGAIAGLLPRIWGDINGTERTGLQTRPYKGKSLGGGFGAENALEAWAGELHADELFAFGLGIGDMDDAAVRGEVRIAVSGARKAVNTPRSVIQKRDADFEVGADGDVKTRHEGGSAAAKIFAGSIFFEGDAAGVAPAHFERQADSDSTFRALPRYGGAERDHGLGPRFR